jgi:hypothetical protein
MGALGAIKLAHTVIWAFFAGCIVAIPILALLDRYTPAAVLSGIVLVEVVIIVANAWRCPLTGVAARYTDDRRDNFDIYLPAWLARHNKTIFGGLFVASLLVTLARWVGSR